MPLLYWKLVIDPATQEHILIIMFLNGETEEGERQKFINKYPCECQCRNLRYNDFIEDDSQGFTRCCSVTDLIKFMPYLSSIKEITDKINPTKMLRNIDTKKSKASGKAKSRKTGNKLTV